MQINKQYFKSYPILLVLLISSQILCFIYARRQVTIFNLPVNCSGIIFPVDLYLIEIIGECFGYEYSRQAVWTNSFAHIFFMFAVVILSTLPYPENIMNADLIFSYKHLIDISWIVILGSLIGTFLGDMFSAHIVPRSKVILHGNFMFLRLFLANLVSELLTTSSYLISFLTNNYDFTRTTKIIVCTLIAKMILFILLWPICRLVIKKVKKIEGMEGFDLNQDYKLLNFAIRDKKINFKGFYNAKA